MRFGVVTTTVGFVVVVVDFGAATTGLVAVDAVVPVVVLVLVLVVVLVFVLGFVFVFDLPVVPDVTSASAGGLIVAGSAAWTVGAAGASSVAAGVAEDSVAGASVPSSVPVSAGRIVVFEAPELACAATADKPPVKASPPTNVADVSRLTRRSP